MMEARNNAKGKKINYSCNRCKSNRNISINVSEHENYLRKSKNGLVTYSDVHICENGLYEVNNLQIDTNYQVRSVEMLKLPEYRGNLKTKIPLPSMKNSDDVSLIRIMDLSGGDNMHLLINDHFMKTQIRIGRFDVTKDDPIETFESSLGGITLFVFPSDFEYNDNLKEWYRSLIDTLEVIPFTKLGMLVETLKYLVNNCSDPPTGFDKTFMKTILASHEVFFKLKDITKVMDLYQEYSDMLHKTDFELIDDFLSALQNNPNMPIQYFSRETKKDLIIQIYLFLILEKEGIIEIQRPGIVETT